VENKEVDGRVVNILKWIKYNMCECGLVSSGSVDIKVT
jgi:hypothetical protein